MANQNPDPNLVRNQGALLISRGTEWVVVSAVLAAVTIAVLLLTGTVTGLVGAILNAALFIAMVSVRFAVSLQRPRLWTLAILLIVMAVASLVTILLAVALL